MNLVTANPRPTNSVSQNLLSEKKNSPHDLSDSNNPRNAEAEQGGVSNSIGQLMRETSRNPAEYSQVRQQENTQIQMPGNRKRERTLRTQKGVGNHGEFLNIWDHSKEDQCIDVWIDHVFDNESSHSSRTCLH